MSKNKERSKSANGDKKSSMWNYVNSKISEAKKDPRLLSVYDSAKNAVESKTNQVMEMVDKHLDTKSKPFLSRFKRSSSKSPNENEIKNKEDMARKDATLGSLTLKIVSAKDLPAADIGGKSDPYCSIYIEDRVFTTSIKPKTLSPVWNEEFITPITQSYTTVFIEVRDHDYITADEVIAECCLELPRDGRVHSEWVKLHHPTKGTTKVGPEKAKVVGEILIEMQYDFSKMKEFWSHFSPLEKFQQKGKFAEELPPLKFHLLVYNFERVKAIARPIISFIDYLGAILTWEDPMKTAIALTIFILLVYFQALLTSIPAILIITLIKKGWEIGLFALREAAGHPEKDYVVVESKEEEALGDDDDEAKEESSRQKIWRLLRQVQNGLGSACTPLEKVRDLFLWKNPIKSARLLFMCILIGYVLLVVPAKYLVMIIVLYVMTVNAAFRRWPKLHRAFPKLNPMFKAKYSTQCT